MILGVNGAWVGDTPPKAGQVAGRVQFMKWRKSDYRKAAYGHKASPRDSLYGWSLRDTGILIAIVAGAIVIALVFGR